MNPYEYLKFRAIDENAIQMLTTGECYFSSPHHFNDPLDCAHSLEGFPDLILKELREKHSKDKISIFNELESLVHKKTRRIDYGVVSFCGRYDSQEISDPILSPDLWGHYADEHKGICVGFSPLNSYNTFDFSNALNPVIDRNTRRFNSPVQPGGTNLLTHVTHRPHEHDNLLSPKDEYIVKVKYDDDFSLPVPDWETVIENYRKNDTINDSTNAHQFMWRLLRNALDIKDVVSNKHGNWSTENEYRLFGSRDKSQSIGAAINSITFGLNASEESIRYITSIIARFYGVDMIELYIIEIRNGKLYRRAFEMNDASPRSSQMRVGL